MTNFRLFCAVVFLSGWLPGFSQGQANRPVISHEAPPTHVEGLPFVVSAEIRSSLPVTNAALFLASSSGVAPVEFPLRPAGAGVYTVRIPSRHFVGVDSFRYYLRAQNNRGLWTESNWMTVRVIDQQEPSAEEAGWVRPTLITVGAVGIIGGVVALTDDGGDDSSGSDDSGSGGGDDGDPADQVIVRTANKTVDAPDVALPDIVQVNADGELAGRSIRRVRIRLEFDSVDAGPEVVEALYNGAKAFTNFTDGTDTYQVDVVGAASSTVTIQVIESEPDGGLHQYSWNATVTYFLD